MPGATTELGIPIALDADDNADYLTLSLANGLRTLDALFNNVTGHNHSSAHQGGPITSLPAGAIPDGSITGAKIADGTITGLDIADRSIPGVKFTQPLNDDILLGANKAMYFVSNQGLGYRATGDFYYSLSQASKMMFGWDTVNAPIAQLQLAGPGATTWAGYASAGANNPGTLVGGSGGVVLINDSVGAAGDGGVVLFGCNNTWWAGLKGFFQNGANNGIGDLSFATRRATTDTVLTEAMRITAAGVIDMSGASATVPKLPTASPSILGVDTAISPSATLFNIALPQGRYWVSATMTANCPTAGSLVNLALRNSAAGNALSNRITSGAASADESICVSGVIDIGPSQSLQVLASSNAAATARRVDPTNAYGATTVSYVRIA